MIALITGVLPIAFALIEFFLKQNAANNAQLLLFYQFVDAFQTQNSSVKLSQSYREQLKRLQQIVATPIKPA